MLSRRSATSRFQVNRRLLVVSLEIQFGFTKEDLTGIPAHLAGELFRRAINEGHDPTGAWRSAHVIDQDGRVAHDYPQVSSPAPSPAPRARRARRALAARSRTPGGARVRLGEPRELAHSLRR